MLDLIRFLYPYFSKHKIALFQYLGYLFVCAAIEFAIPLMLGYFVDGLLTFESLNSIAYFVLAFIGIQLLHILFRYLGAMKNAIIQTKVALGINSDAREHIQNLPLSYFNNKDLLYLSNRVDADSGVLASSALYILQSFLTVATVFTLSMLYIIRIQPVLILIIASMLLFYLVTFIIMKKRLYTHGYRFIEINNKLFSVLSEQIINFMTIKLFGMQGYYHAKFQDTSQKYIKRLVKKTRVDFIASNLDTMTRILAQGGFFILSGNQVMLNNLTVGQFITINGYFNNMTQFFAYFSSLKQIGIDMKISFDRIKEIYSEERERDGDKFVDEDIQNIEIHKISYALNQKTLLNQFSTVFEQGLTVIKGKNGAGKTTLSLALVGLLKDKMQGSIFFNNNSIRNINMADFRARYIGYCSQRPLLFKGTILENIIIPCNLAEINPCNQFLFPNLYSVLNIANEGSITEDQLSGGEKRKISLIRMIEDDLPINILDEPTNDLDIKSKHELIKYLTMMKDKKIFIVITHDEDVSNIADRVQTLESLAGESSINIGELA